MSQSTSRSPFQPKTQAPVVDVLTLTAVQIQDLLTRSVLTTEEIVDKYLSQIQKHNHDGLKLNAVISTPPRKELMQYARKLDQERAAGKIRGPLHGIPLLVKDAYCTPSSGVPTTCGSFALQNATAKEDATVIQKLLLAGMIIIAKANMSEWGNMKGSFLTAGWSAVGGQTQSPYVEGGLAPNATWLSGTGPAGSSSGSAAGVAAGFAPISLGTESDGSIIMPAARAGLYALKCTPGSVDVTGVQPAGRPLDTLGGFTRSITDLAHLTAIMQGHTPGHYLPLSKSWAGLKLGFVDPKLWRSYPAAIEPVEGFFEQTDAAMFAAAQSIEAQGGRVVHAVPLLSWADIISAMPDVEEMEDLFPTEFRTVINQFLENFDGGPKTIEDIIEFNNDHADEEFTAREDNQKMLEMARDGNMTQEVFDRNFNALRERASSHVRSLLEAHDIDVVLGPCDSRTGSVGSASGFPVANLPLGFADHNGRAFSLHMIAPSGQEAKLLQIMSAWEATFPGNVKPPPLLLDL